MLLLYYLFAHNRRELFYENLLNIPKNIMPHCVLFLVHFIIFDDELLINKIGSKELDVFL